MKTARFTSVVERSGVPQTYTPWSDPARDRELQRAVKAGKVMTIHQSNVGTKKDYGTIGFHSDGPALFLIFPRPLTPFQGRRIVGVDYEKVPGPKAPKDRGKNSSIFSRQVRRGTRNKPSIVQPVGRNHRPAARPPRKADEAAAKLAQLLEFAPKTTAREGGTSTPPKHGVGAAEALSREVKAAMKEIKAGKVVAAYERLERATKA
jgi:hypothetical protein